MVSADTSVLRYQLTTRPRYSPLMDAQTAVDLCCESIWIGLMIAAPILLAGTAIGLLIGLFQALTQIQEQTIAIVLKIIVMVLVIVFLMPWMTEKMIDYSAALFKEVPDIMMKETE